MLARKCRIKANAGSSSGKPTDFGGIIMSYIYVLTDLFFLYFSEHSR